MALKPETRLASLPRLSRENAAAAAIPCKICRRPAEFFDTVDFQKCVGGYPFGPSGVHVSWYRCDFCGFLFTSFFDDWSHQDFSRFIYNDDYNLVDPDYISKRPQAMAGMLAHHLAGQEDARILDYGAGRGLLAENMTGLGFRHMESYDPFSLPDRPAGKFDIITCCEVIEHSTSPAREIEDMRSMLRDGGCIVLSESLQPPDIGHVRCNWWYAAPRNGHVSTFTDRTFAVLAVELGLIFHRGAGAIHALRTRHDDGALAEIARRCGPSFASCRLGAPAQMATPGWSGMEDRPPWQFRWTASTALDWRIAIPKWSPGCLQVTVPFAHESRAGFAAECVIEVNGHAARTWVQDRVLMAETGPVEAGEAVLTLRTPELSRAGERAIGLAIFAER
jgi:hypothetical protein